MRPQSQSHYAAPRHSRRLLMSILVIVALVLVACGSKNPPASSSSGGTSAPASGESTTPPPAEKKEYEVAVIRWDPADIYFNGVQLGQEIERKRLEAEEGVSIKFNVFGANDVSKQLTALQTQVGRGVDGVLLVPWRGEAMTAIVTEIREKGIPLVSSNAFVPNAPQIFVAFDNADAGELAGKAIIDRLEKLRGPDWAQNGGVFLELRCIITASFDIGRHTGWHEVIDPILTANPQLKHEIREAGCDGSKARKAVDDILSRYGTDQLLGVMSIDGTMGVGGAVPALASRGILFPSDDPRHIPIATVDASIPELQAIARGEIDHSSIQSAVGEGVLTMRLLYQMMKEGKIIETPATEQIMFEGGDELWQPVQIIPSKDFDGPWYKLKASGVPGDVPVDSQKIWSNIMYQSDKGQWPTVEMLKAGQADSGS